MSYGTVQANAIQGSINTFSPNSAVFRNRIINGAMVIDQRNAGASVSISNNTLYPVDRFPVSNVSDGVISAQRSTTAPSGFINSLQVTVTTADASIGATQYSFIRQNIEGFNVADLNWGTANAQTVTLSFWVRSSVTGTFGGALQNNAENRAYAFTYTINSANTWEQKSVTIAGDTTGTWLTDNSSGIRINFSLGTGTTYSSSAGSWVAQTSFNATGSTALLNTLNATLNITGVQLEVGSTATSFDYRPYTTELQLCQRYYQTVETVSDIGVPVFLRRDTNANMYAGCAALPTRMRAAASVSYTFTNVHKPGVRFDTFGSVTTEANTTEWFMQLVPTTNDTNSIACFPRTGGFQFSAEL